jgi:hypothetical protein
MTTTVPMNLAADSSAEYWSDKVRGAEPPGIVTFGPPSLERDEVAEYFGARIRAAAPSFAQLAAACIALAARYGSNDDAAIVTTDEHSGALLLRASLDAATTFGALVKTIERELAAMQLRRGSAPSPAMLDLSGLLQTAIVEDDGRRVPEWLDGVSLLFLVSGEHGTIRLRYDVSAYPKWFAQQLAEHYVRTLDALLTAPSGEIARFAMLMRAEQRQLIDDSNPPAIAVTSEDDLVTRFEMRVAEAPDAVALTCEGRSVTYAQLDAVAISLPSCSSAPSGSCSRSSR